MIDRIEIIEHGESLIALKNLTINEPFFQGHFPGQPVMPGVYILRNNGSGWIIFNVESSRRSFVSKHVFFQQ